VHIGQPVHYVRNTSGGPDYPRDCQAAMVTVADMPRENEVCLVIFGADHSVKFRDQVPWQPQDEDAFHRLVQPDGGTWHLAETCRNPKAVTENPAHHSRPRS
jgi:hypothetical protein